MKHIFSYLLVGLVFILSSCDLDTETNNLQPDAVGDEGELVVVISDAAWNAKPGKTIQEAFKKPYPRVTTPQPYFDLKQYNEKEFNESIERYKNIFYIQIIDNENYKSPKFKIQEDVWAKGQIVFRLFSQTDEAAQAYIQKNGDNIRKKLDELVRKRFMSQFKKHDNIANEEIMAKKFSVFTEFSDNFQVRIDRENFVWFSSEVNRYVQGTGSHPVETGIIVSEFPYKSEAQLSTKYLNAVRDSVLKKNVRGENNSFMTSEYMKNFEPQGKEINIHDTYGKLIRGRYTFQGDFIAGGSFISLSFVHPATQKVINLYGFVYAPKFDKREYIRKLQAILYSSYPIEPEQKDA